MSSPPPNNICLPRKTYRTYTAKLEAAVQEVCAAYRISVVSIVRQIIRTVQNNTILTPHVFFFFFYRRKQLRGVRSERRV